MGAGATRGVRGCGYRRGHAAGRHQRPHGHRRRDRTRRGNDPRAPGRCRATRTTPRRTDAARHSLASIAPRSSDCRARRGVSLLRVPPLSRRGTSPHRHSRCAASAAARITGNVAALAGRARVTARGRRPDGCRRDSSACPIARAGSAGAGRGGEPAPSGTVAAITLRSAGRSRDRRGAATRRQTRGHPRHAARRPAAIA